MERDGLPNAGFYDQRAVLQWIQDYIALVGGDKRQVSAWGESAGAGSIMHHLTAFGGTQDPLFSRAVLQSPAFQTKFDRKGDLEATFQNFTALAGCAGQDLACLRAASADALDNANIKLNEDGPMGTFAVGPSADGSWVRQLAAVELAQGILFAPILFPQRPKSQQFTNSLPRQLLPFRLPGPLPRQRRSLHLRPHQHNERRRLHRRHRIRLSRLRQTRRYHFFHLDALWRNQLYQ